VATSGSDGMSGGCDVASLSHTAYMLYVVLQCNILACTSSVMSLGFTYLSMLCLEGWICRCASVGSTMHG